MSTSTVVLTRRFHFLFIYRTACLRFRSPVPRALLAFLRWSLRSDRPRRLRRRNGTLSAFFDHFDARVPAGLDVKHAAYFMTVDLWSSGRRFR
ncbi:hypothetical protein ZIOFF_009475 [Zingiber officinale]|uniref:Uncharacterized protein n=1 Tax=Zingiber officinale TaxID=94328 RepID=A0A8J5I2U0_ZINOF|nr:hypothetical protein ZIOFF_009475 [Zingiber officinale]